MIRKAKPASLAFLPLYLFTLVFVIGPLVLMLLLSFSPRDGWSYSAGFTLENYTKILTDETYRNTFVTSLKLAALSTSAVIVLGYPFGLCTALLPKKSAQFFVQAQMIPYWVNSLLRLYGWMIIFRANGLLDKLLMALGITEEPLKLLYTYPAVVVGMIYVLLPFMFTSVYQVAQKLDLSLVEASRDLGAGKIYAFFSVILPLTLPGLKTGIILTFIPSMGLFFIAQILGGSKIVLVGSLIEELLMKAHNQPAAAALSVILMLLTGLVCIILLRKPKWQRKIQ
ncbi:MAG: ABC transporter permease [Clostridia bacterium]|nr:ABC transporter permease [Clostridia bacterium]